MKDPGARQVLEKVWLNVAELISAQGESRLLYFPQSTVYLPSAVSKPDAWKDFLIFSDFLKIFLL